MSPFAGLLTVGIIGAAGALGGSAIGAHAAGKAADAQAQAAEDALALQREQWEKQQADLAPWLTAGKAGLMNLSQLMGIRLFQKPDGTWASVGTPTTDAWKTMDPGYESRINEATKAIERSAAARGGSLGGAAAKGLTRFSQDYASNEFQNVFNREAALAGIGQSSTQQLNAAGQNYANNASDLTTQMGNARASGYMGAGNQWAGAVSGLSQMPMQMYYLSNLMGQKPTNSGGPYSV